MEITRRFPRRTTSAAAARHFVGESLADWGTTPETGLVVLLTSEVVTNAVLHAGRRDPDEELTVVVRSEADMVRVEVTDGQAGILPVRGVALDGLSGRGLLLLDALASNWGVTPAGSGKNVWFEVQMLTL